MTRAAVAACVVVLLAASAYAQSDAGSARTDAGRRTRPTYAGRVPPKADPPDLSGIWQGGGPINDIAEGLPRGQTLPLLASAKKITDARQSKDDPEANCLPTGVPRIAPYPWRIVQTPTHIFFLFEGNIHSYRQIFMDGRQHPADLDPTWYGHSIGRWEGKTLVVDTVGFNDRFWFDFKGHPHTERLHTVERYTLKDVNALVNQITIDDPGAYAKPFTVTFTATRAKPGTELMEYICNENNQDVAHVSGPPTIGGDPDRPQGILNVPNK